MAMKTPVGTGPGDATWPARYFTENC